MIIYKKIKHKIKNKYEILFNTTNVNHLLTLLPLLNSSAAIDADVVARLKIKLPI